MPNPFLSDSIPPAGDLEKFSCDKSQPFHLVNTKTEAIKQDELVAISVVTQNRNQTTFTFIETIAYCHRTVLPRHATNETVPRRR